MNAKNIGTLSIQRLSPYVCARDLYKSAEVFLDANESPYPPAVALPQLPLNRYPDPECTQLRQALARYCGVQTPNILVGNGSDEVIAMAFLSFAQKGDNVITVQPGYSMYDVCAQSLGVQPRPVNLSPQMDLDISKILSTVDSDTKMILLPSPNSVLGCTI